MATKLKFSLSIPDWLYRVRPKNTIKYLKFKLNPFRCDCCGKKVNFKTPQIQDGEGYSRLMVHWWGFSSRKTICRDCITIALKKGPIQSYWYKDVDGDKYSNTFGEFDEQESCDVCKMDSHSYKNISVMTPVGRAKMNFCTNSWNSSCVCKNCMIDTLTHGKESSSSFVMYKDKDGKVRSVPLNEAQLPVIDGKVSFPVR